MIYEFALEPELVASWADRSAYRFFDGKFGIGQRRVASAFPAKDKWREMVVRAFDAAFANAQPAAKQAARQRLDAVLGYLRREMVERPGAMPHAWRDDVVREHAARKFQGILGAGSPRPMPPIIAAEELDESTAAWSPPSPPTQRKVADVVKALEPVLRFCSEARFVDPYLDASLPEFREPLTALLRAAQKRANPGGVRLELHTGIRRSTVSGASNRPDDIACEIVTDCRQAFAHVLARGTSLRVFVWSDNVARAEKIHNRYVLTNVGSVSVPSGLDRAHPSMAHTDDFTLLSREQHDARWRQYCEGSTRFRCVLGGPQTVNSTA